MDEGFSSSDETAEREGEGFIEKANSTTDQESAGNGPSHDVQHEYCSPDQQKDQGRLVAQETVALCGEFS